MKIYYPLPGEVRDTFCAVCHFRISQGVYAYMAGNMIFCQRCVRGPHPYGYEEEGSGEDAAFIPTQRSLESSSAPLDSI